MPCQTKDQDIRQLFERFGEVDSVKIITEKDTGKSKGCGFIVMPNIDHAHDAIGMLKGSMVGNWQIIVTG
ncbi:RNA recognition motif-containing protein [Mucilaginibacter sp. UYCu711]